MLFYDRGKKGGECVGWQSALGENKNTKCQRLNDIKMIDFIPCLLFSALLFFVHDIE